MYVCRKGDYQRYLAEFTQESERKESAEGALVAYKAATELASADLPATNPVRLGLALNFSVRTFSVSSPFFDSRSPTHSHRFTLLSPVAFCLSRERVRHCRQSLGAVLKIDRLRFVRVFLIQHVGDLSMFR